MAAAPKKNSVLARWPPAADGQPPTDSAGAQSARTATPEAPKPAMSAAEKWRQMEAANSAVRPVELPAAKGGPKRFSAAVKSSAQAAAIQAAAAAAAGSKRFSAINVASERSGAAPAPPPPREPAAAPTPPPPAPAPATAQAPPAAAVSAPPSGTEGEQSDWQAVHDAQTGQTYWFNRKTRATTWDDPFFVPPPAPQEAPAPPPPPPPSRKPPQDDWRVATDAASGKVYWYNKATLATTWSPPPGHEHEAPAAIAAAPAPVPVSVPAPAPPTTPRLARAPPPPPPQPQAARAAAAASPTPDMSERYSVSDSAPSYSYSGHSRLESEVDELAPQTGEVFARGMPTLYEDEDAEGEGEGQSFEAKQPGASARLALPITAGAYLPVRRFSRPEAEARAQPQPQPQSQSQSPQPRQGLPMGDLAAGRTPLGHLPQSRAGAPRLYSVMMVPTARAPAFAGASGGVGAFGVSSLSAGASQGAEEAREQRFRQYDMTVFCSTYFNLHKRGLFGNPPSLEELRRHQVKLISQPLLNGLSGKEADSAVQAFRNVTGFMGDRKTSKSQLGHVFKLASMGIAGSGELRDELYMQVIKQMTENPNRESEKRGWQLLALYAGVFGPSERFWPFLMTYLEKMRGEEHEGCAAEAQQAGCAEFRTEHWADYVQERLEATKLKGPRMRPPIQLEIDSVEQQRPIPVRIEFLDGAFKTLAVESQSSVSDLCAALCGAVSLANDGTYGVFQTAINKGEYLSEKQLLPEERLLDVLASWYEKREAFLAENPDSDLKFKLIFKARLFRARQLESLSPAAVHILFVQGAFDVVEGALPVSTELAFTLGGLHLLSLVGPGGDAASMLVGDQVRKFLPRRVVLEKLTYDSCESLLRAVKAHGVLSPHDAKVRYIQLLREHCPTFGCAFFRVRQRQPSTSEDFVFLGIGERGIFFVDPETRQHTRHVPQNEIFTFGFKDDTFFSELGGARARFSFETKQAQQMASLLQSYRS